MRTVRDRIRHAIAFEVIGLMLVIPLGSVGFGLHASDVGIMALVGATMATGWNYIYNLMFDHAMVRLCGRVQKRLVERVIHALLFELGLLVMTLPLIAWYLSIGLVEAFVLDLAFVIFYVVYAFIFNWAYDKVFPIPLVPVAAKGRLASEG